MTRTLPAIRLAHVERIQQAYDRIQARSGWAFEPEGMPQSLVDAGCWLVANGWAGEPAPAERALGWGPDKYRSFMASAGRSISAACVSEGHDALFVGRRAICPDLQREVGGLVHLGEDRRAA